MQGRSIRIALMLGLMGGSSFARIPQPPAGDLLSQQKQAGTLTIMAGSRAAVLPDASGHFRIVSGAELKAQPETAPASRDAKTETYQALSHAAFDTADGTITFSMWSDAETGTRLKMENGLNRPVAYEAYLIPHMTFGEAPTRGRPTTICSAPAHGVSYEQWTGKLDAIFIVRLIEAPAGKPFCYDPSKPSNPFYDPPAN